MSQKRREPQDSPRELKEHDPFEDNLSRELTEWLHIVESSLNDCRCNECDYLKPSY